MGNVRGRAAPRRPTSRQSRAVEPPQAAIPEAVRALFSSSSSVDWTLGAAGVSNTLPFTTTSQPSRSVGPLPVACSERVSGRLSVRSGRPGAQPCFLLRLVASVSASNVRQSGMERRARRDRRGPDGTGRRSMTAPDRGLTLKHQGQSGAGPAGRACRAAVRAAPAGRLVDDRDLAGQTDQAGGHDERAGDPVSAGQHDDPENNRGQQPHGQERRPSDLPVELLLGSHGAPPCSSVTLIVAADDRAVISRTPRDHSAQGCRAAGRTAAYLSVAPRRPRWRGSGRGS